MGTEDAAGCFRTQHDRVFLPGLRKDQGLAKKGRELGAVWEEGGVPGREGSPAPACPLSRARTLPGSPGVAAAQAARPRIASLPGRAAPAWPAAPGPEIGLRGARRGRRAAGGAAPAAARSVEWGPTHWTGPRAQRPRGGCGAQARPDAGVRVGWVPRRDLGRVGQGSGGGCRLGIPAPERGWGTAQAGRWTRGRADIGGPGSPAPGQPRGWGGADLTAGEEARRAGRADGRPEEFAAGGRSALRPLAGSLPLET